MNKVKNKCRYAKNGLSKRVMVVKGTEHSGFEEIIFILREEGGLSPRDFLVEAERLAGEYAEKTEPKSTGRLLWVLSGLSLCLALSWVLYFLLG